MKNQSGSIIILFLLFLPIIITDSLFAQISVTQQEFINLFTPGNLIYATEGTEGSINIGQTGGSNEYDFTGENVVNLIVLNNYEVSQVPFLAERYPPGATTLGESLQDMDGTPVFLSSDDSVYFVGGVTTFEEYGFEHYLPYGLVAEFPVNYLYSFSQNYDVYDTTFDLSWQILSTQFYSDMITATVDGYGTLKIPGMELQCLRMKREYSYFQDKEYFYLTKEGVLGIASEIESTEPDTGNVQGYRQLLFPANFVGVEDEKYIPVKFELKQNYPNPFNPVTSIQYAISSRQFVTLKIYSILGREIKTLVNEEKPAGEYEVEFSGSELPSGIYFYKLVSGNYSATKKMILLK